LLFTFFFNKLKVKENLGLREKAKTRRANWGIYSMIRIIEFGFIEVFTWRS
jgi:hypothetical protein